MYPGELHLVLHHGRAEGKRTAVKEQCQKRNQWVEEDTVRSLNTCQSIFRKAQLLEIDVHKRAQENYIGFSKQVITDAQNSGQPATKAESRRES